MGLYYKPQIGQDVFITNTATIVGKVKLGDKCSVWYGAVIRGDEEYITVGEGSNIQDNCVLHADVDEPIIIGKECIIGHGAVIHGATIGDNTLIGIRSTVMNRARVGKCCVIGAHALITQDMEIPDFSVVMGIPGKIVKKLSQEHKAIFEQGARVYIDLAQEYLQGKYQEWSD